MPKKKVGVVHHISDYELKQKLGLKGDIVEVRRNWSQRAKVTERHEIDLDYNGIVIITYEEVEEGKKAE